MTPTVTIPPPTNLTRRQRIALAAVPELLREAEALELLIEAAILHARLRRAAVEILRADLRGGGR